MKAVLFGLLAVFAVATTPAQAIDVDEIIDGYWENVGGTQAWADLSGVKMTGEFNQGGMKFPFELVNLKDGRQYMKFTFQGKEIKQGVFDGETMWGTNFMTMKAEKADAETTANQKLEANDFPSDLFNYKQKGYTAELIGTETIDGTDAYKVKLVKEPVTIDGKQVDDITYYYFDTEALVPLVAETELKSGPGKGQVAETKLSDFQEIDGLYFPFAIAQGIKGGGSASMMITKIELNPSVDESVFAMPVETEETAQSPE